MKRVIILFVFGLTACSGGGGSSNPAQTISCESLGIDGTWLGTIASNADTMEIAANCTTTSTYCQSSSTVTIKTVSETCNAGVSSCGTMSFRVNYNNNNGNCAATGQTYNCNYAVNTAKTIFEYDCGAGAVQYSR